MISILAIIKKDWKTWLGLGLVVLLIFGYLHVKSLKADNARLKQENQIHQAAVVSLTEDLMANKRALETREAESRKLAQEHEAVLAELERVYESDLEACEWGAEKLPDGIYSALCGGAK